MKISIHTLTPVFSALLCAAPVSGLAASAADTSLRVGGEVSGQGLKLSEIGADSPLARYAQPGDVLVAIDELAVSSEAALQGILKHLRPGDEIMVTLDGPKGRFKCAIVVPANKPAAPAPVQPVSSAPPAASPPAAVASTPAPAKASDSAKKALVISAQGPGADGSAALIAGAYSDRLYADLRYVYGVSPLISIDAEVLTQISINTLDAGVRFHLYGGSAFSFAARLRAHEEHILRGGASLVLLGTSGGLIASFGTERLQWTVGMDGTLHLAGWVMGQKIPPGLVAYSARPYLAAEFAVGMGVNMVATAEVRTMQIQGADTIVVPGGSIGVAF